MAAKVIKFNDGNNTYELTFTRESAEATERMGFQITEYLNGINLLKNSQVLFYGSFMARNRGIKRKEVDTLFSHVNDKEGLMVALVEAFSDSIKSLISTSDEDDTAKNATWEIV